MTFGTEIHIPVWMNCTNFDYPFNLAPSSDQTLNLFYTLVYDHIPAAN